MPRSADTNSRLFPDKESRYRCWESRDAYWACLDKKGLFIINSLY